MTPELLNGKISELYTSYNEVIKPLIAEIESRFEHFPLPMFNEIRALNNHIAQCYRKGVSDETIEKELFKAERHIRRIISDCYKYLNVSLHDRIIRFERQTRRIDLTLLDNGTFYSQYLDLRKRAEQLIRNAKRTESSNNDESLDLFQDAYNTYTELEELILGRTVKINWARVKFTSRKVIKLLLWFLTAVISGFISLNIGCEAIKAFWEKLF